MSLSIGNRLNGIIPRGALAQVNPQPNAGGGFAPPSQEPGEQSQLQHGRASDLAGTMPAASWQVLANAAEHPAAPESRQIDKSYGYVAQANHKHANPDLNAAA
ncbi:hypothetical protein MTBLM1_30132 [Rhodospirillaceae bacterium LM-1]|nr:hypothetical protein MTBLM1_30132 [Rhodospirillaceae bacterium LM-1]